MQDTDSAVRARAPESQQEQPDEIETDDEEPEWWDDGDFEFDEDDEGLGSEQ